jgi:streptogramin lyase
MTEQITENEGEPTQRRRKRRDLILLILLFLAVVAISVSLFFYATCRPAVAPVTAPAGVSVPHFVFSIDNIAEPLAVAASPLGDRIFVSEGTGDKRILVFDRAGKPIGSITIPLANPLQERSPDALTVGTDNRLYVIDSSQREVLIYTLDGELVGTFLPDNDPNFQWFPTSLAMDKAGNMYVTDQTEGRHRVMVFDPTGKLVLKFGISGTGNGMFLFPSDILVDSQGRIFVADSSNTRIQVFDSQGKFLNVIYGTGLSLPRSLFMDSEGRLHVLDSLGHSVAVVTLGNPVRIQYRYGDQGRGAGQFYFPSDLANDETGRIYIADRFNNRVQVWSF